MTIQEHLVTLKLRWRCWTQPFRKAPSRVAWLVGSGRSGTTWISSLLNADAKAREMFEPMHVLHTPWMKQGPTHPHLAPHQVTARIQGWFQSVFEGRHITPRTDRDNIGKRSANADKLIVKDVFASAAAGAISSLFPDVAVAVVMRHPAAVALSKQSHRHWHWQWSVAEFQQNPQLVDDHLTLWSPALAEFSSKPRSEWEELIAVWCVLHIVLFQSLPKDTPILHYERLSLDPTSMEGVLKHSPGWRDWAFPSHDQIQAAATTMSFVSKASDASQQANPTRWKGQVSDQLEKEARAVLGLFGMDDWYDDDGLPNEGVIQRWREAHAQPLT